MKRPRADWGCDSPDQPTTNNKNNLIDYRYFHIKGPEKQTGSFVFFEKEHCKNKNMRYGRIIVQYRLYNRTRPAVTQEQGD